jgi:hypothetical protein
MMIPPIRRRSTTRLPLTTSVPAYWKQYFDQNNLNITINKHAAVNIKHGHATII